MFKVLTCVAVEHDLRLVALAGLFCLASCLTAFRLHARGLSAGRGRLIWVALTGLAAGSGIWATHFIAMLAYKPSAPVGFDPLGTLGSLAVAAVTTGAGFLVSSPGRRGRNVLAGLLLGSGVATMHYCGMAALRAAAQVTWDPAQVAASVLLGAALAVTAMLAFRDQRSTRDHLVSAVVLTLAICALHFTAMSAVTLRPDPTVVPPLQLLSREQMIFGVAMLTGFILAGGLALVGVDVQTRRTSRHNTRLLFERNPVAMWLLEPSTFRFRGVNDAAVREYGYTRAQFLSMTVFDVLAPAEREAARAILAKRSDYEGERVWRHLKADGAEILVQPYMQTLPYAGRRCSSSRSST